MKNPFKSIWRVNEKDITKEEPSIVYPFSTQDHTGIRRSGQSTRLVDKYIQELFEGKEIKVVDHHWGLKETNTDISITDYNRRASEYLNKTILRRLSIEHNITSNSRYIRLIIIEDNRGRITMKLTQQEK